MTTTSPSFTLFAVTAIVITAALIIRLFAMILLFNIIIDLFIDDVVFCLFNQHRGRWIRTRHDLHIARHHNITTLNVEWMRARQGLINKNGDVDEEGLFQRAHMHPLLV